MKIVFILDELWDSALTDYAFKLYKESLKLFDAYLFCVKGSFIAKKTDKCEHIEPLRNKNPLKTIISFFDLYRKLRFIEPDVVVTIRGDAAFFACLLKKKLNYRLFRIFKGDRKFKTPAECLDKLILPCEYLKDYIVDKDKIGKIVILKSFVDTEKYRFSKEGRKKIRKLFNLEKKIVFGSVGRLDKVKGYDLLIKAFAKANIDRSFLFIVGEERGVKKKELDRLAKKLRLDNVFILAERRNDIVDIMSGFDVGVVSSIDSEVIPRVLFEFLSVGLPTVTTDVGCLGEIAKEAGLISVKPEIEQLSKVLIKIADEYKNLKREDIAKLANMYKINLSEGLFEE